MVGIYSILVVEDEEIIRRALPLVIDWNAIGFQIVEASGSAAEALKYLENNKVDLVLTDIRMPVINGLELACELNSRFPAVKTILLSAYRDFEYAVKGIEYGVYGYLLKSANKDEIRNYFLKLKEALDRENEITEKQEDPAGNFPGRLWMEYRLFLNNWLDLKEDYDRQRLICDGIAAGIDLSGQRSFTAACLELDGRRGLARKLGEEALSAIDNRIRYYISSLVEENQNGYITELGNRILLILTVPENNLHSFLQSLFDGLVEELSLVPENTCCAEITLTCAAGKTVNLPESLKDSLQSALSLIRKKVFLGGGILLFSDDTEAGSLPGSAGMWLDETVGQVDALLAEKKFGILAELLGQIEERLTADRICDLTAVQRYARKLLEMVSELCHRLNPARTGSFDAYELAELVSEADTICAALTPVKELLFRLDGLYAEGEARPDISKLVEKAVKYIQEHYAADLRLDEVAAHVSVHPVYLCRLFRQEKNSGFKDILTDIRMEKAKELLSDIGYKVYEVSMAVGYAKPKYFSNLFKKVTGLTPLEYRDRCR